MSVVVSVCQGCGGELPPNGAHRPRKWCSERCRKAQYSTPCEQCGAPTDGSKGRAASPRHCADCWRVLSPDVNRKRKVWTREAIIRVMQEWNAVYGEPPAAADWNPWQARQYHDEARAVRFETESPRWPSFRVVVDEFGNWNAAIIAAGFEPRAGHGGAGNEFRRRRVTA